MGKCIGLTGGIGCGKSTAAQLLAELGWKVIDTDETARAIVNPEQAGWKKLKEVFGDVYFRKDKTLNRALLAETVFKDPQQLAQLNAILHPLIRQHWKKQAKDFLDQGNKVLVVIPLLYETSSETEFEKVVAIGCALSTMRQRVYNRGWTEEQFVLRLAAQWPLEKKVCQADFVIWNDGSLALLQNQIRQLNHFLS